MVELSLRGLFQDLNASKVVVYTAVLLWSILLAAKRDGSLELPYWAVFVPLLAWKALAIAGAIVGFVVHSRSPPLNDAVSEAAFVSLILSFCQHLLLLAFEILAVYKLDSGDARLYWILVFAPLLAHCLFCVGVCVWSLRREQSLEFELLFAVNSLQLLFLGLKLDGWVGWAWVVVLIPLWILICLSVIGVLYAIVLAVLLLKSIELLPEHRRQHVYTAITYTFLVVPILIFLVLLTSKLDGSSDVPWLMVCTPLYVSLLCLILISCGTRGGNPWWFGMRKDFCAALLGLCPCLQEYGNVSVKISRARPSWSSGGDSAEAGGAGPRRPRRHRHSRSPPATEAPDGSHLQLTQPQPQPHAAPTFSLKDLKPLHPVVTIDLPD